jgi:uncharacterized protein YecT (DUF1311 family)
LYKTLKSRINNDNKFLSELNNINENYNKEMENAQTQMEMNTLTGEYLVNTDKILNEVYQEIKINVNQNDFERVKSSEIVWLNEFEEYQKYMSEQDYGSMSGLLYSKAAQDIKQFRTLLLIFYLERNRKP